jgi:CRISPR-associated endoribonuclease Cas6
MRVHIRINANKIVIPFEHQPMLVGTIHKWLGINNEHGKVSLYSFSRLEGGEFQKRGLKFTTGCSFFFSAHKPELIKKLIAGIRSDPEMFLDLVVKEVIIEEDPNLTEKDFFLLGSPIFIKKKTDTKTDHILYDDPRASNCLMDTIHTKMKAAGLNDEPFNIQFDKTYPKATTNLIDYNGVMNKASWCPLIIKGSAEIKLFIWNVGLGNSTGIGFGAIK